MQTCHIREQTISLIRSRMTKHRESLGFVLLDVLGSEQIFLVRSKYLLNILIAQ